MPIILVVFVLSGCTNRINSGIELLETEKYGEAKEIFQQEIEKKKHLDEAYRGLGIACFELKEYEDAVEAFEMALKYETVESATLFGIMGACYIENGEYEKALDVYTKALSMKHLTNDIEQEIQYNLIAVYENMADWDAAKKQMDAYRKAYPDDERTNKEADFLETR